MPVRKAENWLNAAVCSVESSTSTCRAASTSGSFPLPTCVRRQPMSSCRSYDSPNSCRSIT